MKKLVFSALLIFPFAFGVLTSFAQTLNGNVTYPPDHCGTNSEYDDHVKNNPALLQEQKNFEARMEVFTRQQELQRTAGASSTSSVPRIIPVVVHVLYENCDGAENISKEQILDAIRALNLDFRKLNPDTANTPAAFRPFAADCNVEFRMAQLDPNGNCTDGIVRVRTDRTNSCYPRDSLKRVSYWPTDKYLNLWVVKSIWDDPGSGSIILGYAHFPWDTVHRAITDGVVVRHDRFGTIGTAATQADKNRTATHEVGHWLGLYHTWGDDNGMCTGTDNCLDTPNEADMVYGCPGGSATTAQFPYYDGCTTTGNGIMYMNYMDYATGECKNLFTSNQKSRMDQVLAVNGIRSVLVSNANLIATGTDGTPSVVCAPKAAVCEGNGKSICQHGTLTFKSSSFNADSIVSYSWQFPGGNPAFSTDSNPAITYDTLGVYGYSLTVTSSGGADSIYYNNGVTVHGPASIWASSLSTMEDFELASSFPGDGYVINPDNGITWQRVTNAGYSGVASLKMDNYSYVATEVDDYITPSYDVHQLVGLQLKFQVANAQKSSTSNEQLNVYVSTNCGATWGVARKRLAGAQLATAGIVATTPFTPTSASQWRQITVNPGVSASSTNIRFKFENVCDRGNNTYIDDINITATQIVGIEEAAFEAQGFQVFPNPASGVATVRYNLATPGDVVLTLLDPLGREVKTIVQGKKELGIHEKFVDVSSLSRGIYFLNLKTPNSSLTTKFVVK